jgi:hypothetical protein
LKSLLASSSTRTTVLWTDTVYTPIPIQPAFDNDVLGPQFTWILSSSISLSSVNQKLYQKLVGILTVESVIRSVIVAPINAALLNVTYSIWEQYEHETFPRAIKVNYYALFAFDAAWSLNLSLQQLCLTSQNYLFSCTSMTSSRKELV